MLLWKEMFPHPKITEVLELSITSYYRMQFYPSANFRADWVVLDSKWSKLLELNRALMQLRF